MVALFPFISKFGFFMSLPLQLHSLGPSNPQCPQDYAKNATVQQDRALENLSGWVFRETDLVLDIGSGNGRVTASIAQQVPHGKVVGLDIDPQMCHYASLQYPLEQYPNLEFAYGDACMLNYCEAFDKITCFATLSWIALEHHHKIFAGIARALKLHGKGLLRMSAVGYRPLNEAIAQVCQNSRWNPYFSKYLSPASYQSHDRIRAIISSLGLKLLRLEDATKTSSFITKEAFTRWLLTWEPSRNQIPENLRDAFMAEVTECYCERMNFEEKVQIQLPGLLIEVEKTKG